MVLETVRNVTPLTMERGGKRTIQVDHLAKGHTDLYTSETPGDTDVPALLWLTSVKTGRG